MHKRNIDVEWQGLMEFKTSVDGHTIVLDASPEVGGENKGPRPKPLMLVALAGCAGMDVVSILAKMRVELEHFNIHVEGDMTDTHPMHYKKIHLVYEFKGHNLPIAKLQKAVKLTEEKYCGVYSVYKQVIKMSSEIRVL